MNTVVRGSTTTGYYLKKFLDLNVKFNGVQNPATAFHYYPIIRLADVLLMYSEAMTLGYGIDTDPEGFGLTAKGAIEMVRRRAGFTTTDKFLEGVTTPEKMLEKIKQERRIELSFEETQILRSAPLAGCRTKSESKHNRGRNTNYRRRRPLFILHRR